MPKTILSACLLSLLWAAGCTCRLNEWNTINFDPFDDRTMAEKEEMDEEDAAWEAANEELRQRNKRPSAIYP